MISITKDKRMLGYESLSSYSNISHFVTTRQGGKLCVIQLYALQWRRGRKGPAESDASDGRNVADTRRTGDSCADP